MTERIWHPHVTVASVVFAKGKYLLVREKTPEGVVFNQPAGHWEDGETLIEAAIRETLEETGHLVKPTGILGLSHFLPPASDETYLRITFVAEAAEQVIGAKLDDGIIEARWMTFEEVRDNKSICRSPLVLRDIERHRSQAPQPLSLIEHFGIPTRNIHE